MEKMDTNPTKYVVFDVETNGLKSKKDDLLSISFYKPDDGKEYCKFLPLELNRKIVTTHINGITEKDLANATALTQAEFDCIIQDFELEKRTILIYAGKNFDASFLLILPLEVYLLLTEICIDNHGNNHNHHKGKYTNCCCISCTFCIKISICNIGCKRMSLFRRTTIC